MPNDVNIEDAAMEKQYVRLFDILVFGPILIYIGATSNLDKNWKIILILMGIGTIIYNGYYFFKYST